MGFLPSHLSHLLSKEAREELSSLKLSELAFVSKGYRGLVFKASLNGQKVAVKVKRSDAEKENLIEREFNFLKHLQKLYGSSSPAPAPIFLGKELLVMEWIEGEALKEMSPEVLIAAAETALLLDEAKVEHRELKGGKHLFYIKEEKRVRVIDFESARFSENPRNFLQLLGAYLLNPSKKIKAKRERAMEVIELYRSGERSLALKKLQELLL